MISDKQVLLEKIEIKEGTTTKLNTNLYVSYRSGNAQKFWANLAIATAGVAVSTQLQSSPSAEGNNANSISPLIPLGVSVATLPSIWKNRPRGVPQAGLWLQHRDTRGRLTDTWQQPISSEAKNGGELLSVNIDKPLSAGTVEVYLQNGSKNAVYYWGLNTVKNTINLIKDKIGIVATKPNRSARTAGCPDGYLPNGQGMCCSPFTGECVNEDGGGDNPPPPPPPNPQGCPDGYLPNGQGMCCSPFTGQCVNEGSGGNNGGQNLTETKTETIITPVPVINSNGGCPAGYLPNGQGLCCMPSSDACVPEVSATSANGRMVSVCLVTFTRGCNFDKTDCTEWRETDRECWTEWEPDQIGPDGEVIRGGGRPRGGGTGVTDCLRGFRVSNGQPCGVSMCSNIDNRDQYGNPCGTPRCNAQFGTDQYGTFCNTEIKTKEITTPCLKSALASIAQLMKNASSDSFLGMLKSAFGNGSDFGRYTINFKEASSVVGTDGKQVPAQTGLIDNTNTITITLNTSILPGTSREYQIMTILHEAMHAYMQVTNNNPSHSEMAGTTFLLPLVRAVIQLTGMGGRDALALCLSGMDGAQNSGNFLNALDLSDPSLTKQDVINIGKQKSNAVETTNSAGETIIKQGGSNCIN
jgi:hypothetical protein